MPVRTRRFIQSAMLALALNATAASPYLPLIGPPVLRFEPPRVDPLQTQPQLPPLPPLEPKVSATEPAPLAPADAAPGTPHALPTADLGARAVTNNPSPPAGNLPEGAPQAPPSPPPPSAIAEPAPGTIENLTPQMFMKFFTGRPGTNATGSGTTIFAPLPFLPPVPPTPPSSSATYQTTPPAKP
jgi:hypothetical protein